VSLRKVSLSRGLGSEPIEFRASGSQNYSYTGGTLADNTIISATITVEELDKDLPENHSYQAQVASTAIMNWIRTRAISSILIKKGLFTRSHKMNT
jgi:hypothetical protein